MPILYVYLLRCFKQQRVQCAGEEGLPPRLVSVLLTSPWLFLLRRKEERKSKRPEEGRVSELAGESGVVCEVLESGRPA